MDNIKDKQKTENVSHFVNKETIKTNPFGDNKMALRAYKKAERLVAAIYLVTNHISFEEPIRTIVRKEGANLLTSILGLRDEMRTVGSTKVSDIEQAVRHLISLIRILAVSGYVSFENADVLTDGLDELGIFMETSRRSVLSENIRLSREELLDVQSNQANLIKDIRDNEVKIIKDNFANRSIENSQKDTSGNTRTLGILQVLNNGTELSIKDIALNLPEYSEKMIQRELAELVSGGQVQKIGSKRWSRYALPQPAVVREGEMNGSQSA